MTVRYPKALWLLVALTSCVTVRVEAPRPERSPVYDCQAEDGSGRVVRVEYAGNPVDLSEGLADEPGGLWSCWPVQGETEHASASAALTDLRFAAETTIAASCSPYPWRLAAEMECR